MSRSRCSYRSVCCSGACPSPAKMLFCGLCKPIAFRETTIVTKMMMTGQVTTAAAVATAYSIMSIGMWAVLVCAGGHSYACLVWAAIGSTEPVTDSKDSMNAQ